MFLCVQRIITKKSSEIIKYNIRAIVRLFFFLLLLLLRPIGTAVRQVPVPSVPMLIIQV